SLALMLAFSLNSFAQDAAGTETATDAAATEAAGAEQVADAAAAGDAAAGKALSNSQCAACHKLDGKSTGPALRGVADKRDREWLYKWIKNSSALIKAGDPLAVKVFEENDRKLMTPFPQ